MRIAASTLVLLTALALHAEAGGQATSPYLSKRGDRVSFEGKLDSTSVQRIIEQLHPNANLVINSDGGDQGAAIRLGNEIVSKNIKVTVNSRCVSACALFVFAPAPSKEIWRGAYVWFHNTPDFWAREMASHRAQISPNYYAAIQKNQAEALALFARTGVDPAIMRCIDEATGARLKPASTSEQPDGHIGQAGSAPVVMDYYFVSLSPKVLSAFGVNSPSQFEYDEDVSVEDIRDFFGITIRKVFEIEDCKIPPPNVAR